jgi:hypothetical protein
MCRFRSGAVLPPRRTALAERPLYLVHGFVRGAFSRSASSWHRVPPAGPPSADQFAQPHQDLGSPCATACRGRRSSAHPASPVASLYPRPTSAAAWPPASSQEPPLLVSCRRRGRRGKRSSSKLTGCFAKAGTSGCGQTANRSIRRPPSTRP